MPFDSLLPALWSMLPAYVPNNAAVLFGDGKTWRGTAAGVIAGTLLAGLLNRLAARFEGRIGRSLPRFSARAAVALAAGAMAGDVAASFLKRRSGRSRGAMVPGLDQLDFVAGAFALARLLAPDWFHETFTRPAVAAVLVATPLLHVATNGVAYLLGLKEEPW